MTTPTAELLAAELDTALTDAVRRAANRAEHMRLVRMQGLVSELRAALGPTADPSSTVSPPAA